MFRNKKLILGSFKTQKHWVDIRPRYYFYRSTDTPLTHIPKLFALVPMPPICKHMHVPSLHNPWRFLEPPQEELLEFINKNTEHLVKCKFQINDTFWYKYVSNAAWDILILTFSLLIWNYNLTVILYFVGFSKACTSKSPTEVLSSSPRQTLYHEHELWIFLIFI